MSSLSRGIRGRDGASGGNLSYPSERLYEEVAYLARYLHWSYDAVMSLDHLERQKWVAEVAKVNERMNEEARRRG